MTRLVNPRRNWPSYNIARSDMTGLHITRALINFARLDTPLLARTSLTMTCRAAAAQLPMRQTITRFIQGGECNAVVQLQSTKVQPTTAATAVA